MEFPQCRQKIRTKIWIWLTCSSASQSSYNLNSHPLYTRVGIWDIRMMKIQNQPKSTNDGSIERQKEALLDTLGSAFTTQFLKISFRCI